MVIRKFKKAIVTFSIAGILVTSSASASHAVALRLGSRGSNVNKLQNQLKSLGYLKINNTTHYFGTMTDNALRSYQRSKGLAVDGSAGPATMASLNGISSSSSNSSNVLNGPALRLGSRGSNVKKLQDQLKSLGYLKINSTTTYFGNMTDKALRAFQKRNGLAVDGSAGPATQRKLNSSPKKAASSSSSSSSSQTVDGLRLGSRGSNVKKLQNQLKSLGYLKINNTTTYFGNMTDKALRAFQKRNGLAVDGSAGPATQRKLNGSPKKAASNNTPNRGSTGNGRNDIGTRIANSAKKHLGKKYVYGGNVPNSIDCSGLMVYVYKEFGINLPRTTSAQANVGIRVSKSNLKVGDLIVFSNTYKAGPSHTGIYIGNGNFIHAANERTGVTTSSINSGY